MLISDYFYYNNSKPILQLKNAIGHGQGFFGLTIMKPELNVGLVTFQSTLWSVITIEVVFIHLDHQSSAHFLLKVGFSVLFAFIFFAVLFTVFLLIWFLAHNIQ